MIEIGFYATLRPIVGGKKIGVDLPGGASAQDLVEHLIERFPGLAPVMLDESGSLSRKVHIFIDGRSVVHLAEGLGTELTDQQRIDIFPAVAGG